MVTNPSNSRSIQQLETTVAQLKSQVSALLPPGYDDEQALGNDGSPSNCGLVHMNPLSQRMIEVPLDKLLEINTHVLCLQQLCYLLKQH